MSVNINQVGGNLVAKNSGNKDNGTLRVCIATDDVNLSQIQANIVSIQSDINAMKILLNSLYDIVNDVWDSTAHALRTTP